MKQEKQIEWYWTRGLHDANIISATKKEKTWDYSDNCLILKLDCDGALFESDITEIHFHKFKIIPNDFDINLMNGGWWLSDQLSSKGNGYLLSLRFDTAKCKTKRIEILFNYADVLRK